MARLLSSGSRSGRGGAAAFILVWTFIGGLLIFAGETLERIRGRGNHANLTLRRRAAPSRRVGKTTTPHPEKHRVAMRLEGWATCLVATHPSRRGLRPLLRVR